MYRYIKIFGYMMDSEITYFSVFFFNSIIGMIFIDKNV